MRDLMEVIRIYVQLKSFDFGCILERKPVKERVFNQKIFLGGGFVTIEHITPLALRMHCEMFFNPTKTLTGVSRPSIWITDNRRLVVKREGEFFHLSVWKIKASLSANDIESLRAALSGDSSKTSAFLVSEIADFTKRTT